MVIVIVKVMVIMIVMGHRKQQLRYTEGRNKLLSFSKFILQIFVQPTTYQTSSQVFHKLLGRSSSTGVGTEDQHRRIVPKPR